MSAYSATTQLNKIYRRAFISFAGIVVLLSPGLSMADPIYKPINKIEHLTDYFLCTRCAGLMTAVAYWMGKDAKDKDLQTTTLENAKFFTALAIRDGVDSGVSIENLRSQALLQVTTSRDMYLSRFQDNFAASGQGYGDDKEVKSDILFCIASKKYIWSE